MPPDGTDAATRSELDGGPSDAAEVADATGSRLDGGASAEDAQKGGEAGPGDDAETANGCASNPCQHGGVCNDDGDEYSCDCADTGHQGAHCEIDIDECAGTNVCSGTSSDGVAFSYQCLNEAPYYTCEGQFPDWPLADRPNRFGTGFRLVDDAKTGLQWEHPVNAMSYTWEGAKTYCEGKGGDWRMPTKAELESIVDDTRSDPAIDISAFPDTPGLVFWSSAFFAGIAGIDNTTRFAWGVSFRDGGAFPIEHLGSASIRCVRRRE